MHPRSARIAGLPPQRPGEETPSYRARLLRPTGDAVRDALARGWADHAAGRASWQRDWHQLAELCNPRQCRLTPPGEPVPLVLSADGARGFYLLGLAGLEEQELSRQVLRDAVFFLSQTGPGQRIVQDLVPGYYPEVDIPRGNLDWLAARDLWVPEAARPAGDGPQVRPVAPLPQVHQGPQVDAPVVDAAPAPPGAEDTDPDPDDLLALPGDAGDWDPEPQGLAGPCSVCGHLPGTWHKCCPVCSASAEGEPEVERCFGFRTLRGKRSPQTWCRRCRAGQMAAPGQLALLA